VAIPDMQISFACFAVGWGLLIYVVFIGINELLTVGCHIAALLEITLEKI
jgi:hypothetical protein